MRIHFIAIGGSAMHNLALALHHKGYVITGSDDEIVEPSKSRLAACGLLPDAPGWFPGKITGNLEAIVLGMHARGDNPELLRARELGLKIFSYPEFLYEQTRDKIRVVIGGSHGKTTITSMIMHVLRESGMAFDYMVGAQLEGFDTMVGLRNDSRIAIFEGDEYLSSPEDRRPKFHLYHPHIGVLSGIAWDHINVFPTFENYVEQFRRFAELIEPGGRLFYFKGDPHLQNIAAAQHHISCTAYEAQPAEVRGQQTCLIFGAERVPLKIFGEHNLQNISAAMAVCRALGISDDLFYGAMSKFTGAARRLEVLAENDSTTVFRDFAHSPSKLQATTRAVKSHFPGRRLVACMELHTFSSLKREFLPHYRHTMDNADEAYVYFSPHTVEHKKLEPITPEMVSEGFGTPGLKVTTDANALFAELEAKNWTNCNLLLMSSGNFDGKDLPSFAQIVANNSYLHP